jgi:endonuclease YncB( thermonuclease family)
VTGRDRIESMIRAEIDRRRPLDLSREALILMAMAQIRVGEDGGDDFEILDSQRKPRVMIRDGRETAATIPDLVDDLAAAHPLLFEPPRTDVKPGPAQRDWLLVTNDAAPPGPPPTEEPLEPVPPTTGDAPLESLPPRETLPIAAPRRFVAGLKARRRPVIAGLAALCALAVAVPFVLAIRDEAAVAVFDDDPATTGSTAFPRTLPPVRTPDIAPPAAAGAVPEAASRPTPSSAPPAPRVGVPEVIDTTTLRIGGEVLRLQGVEWARGGNPDDLRAYLAGREVSCRPAEPPTHVRCEAGGRDLSVVVLYNGGAKAAPGATEEMRAAEQHARFRGAGVWKQP